MAVERRNPPPSVQPNDTAPRTLPHSSGDRTTHTGDIADAETFRGGVQRRPNLDAPERSEKD